MLRSSELKAIEKLHGRMTIKEIARALDRSPNYTSEVVKDLEKKNLVEIDKQGREKLVSPAQSKAIELYRDITQRYPHIDFNELLSGKSIEVLYELHVEATAAEIAENTGNYRNTVYRVLDRFQERGIVGKQNGEYRLLDEFKVLHEFAYEYIHHAHNQKIEEQTYSYSILWESLDEFLVQTPDELQNGFHETGPRIYGDYGLPLFTTETNYYLYSERVTEITSESLVCHTLLIETDTRYLTYCLLLIKKEVTPSKLLMESEKYGVREKAEHLLDYLESRGEKRNDSMPSWQDFRGTASDYGVEV